MCFWVILFGWFPILTWSSDSISFGWNRCFNTYRHQVISLIFFTWSRILFIENVFGRMVSQILAFWNCSKERIETRWTQTSTFTFLSCCGGDLPCLMKVALWRNSLKEILTWFLSYIFIRCWIWIKWFKIQFLFGISSSDKRRLQILLLIWFLMTLLISGYFSRLFLMNSIFQMTLIEIELAIQDQITTIISISHFAGS